MVGSDSSGGHRRRGYSGRSVRGGRGGESSAGSGVEETLRRLVVWCGAALVALALWQVAADTSLAALTAIVGSETGQWGLVVVFGVALILAARRTRRPDPRL